MTMRGVDEHHERLISRVLDGEATAAERATLQDLLRRHAGVRNLYAELSALDRAAAAAMRGAMCRVPAETDPAIAQLLRMYGGAAPRSERTFRLRRWSQWGAGALAAAVALVAWMSPLGQLTLTRYSPTNADKSARASWFSAPAPAATESFSPGVPGYERPTVRVHHTQRDWVLIPTDVPRQYYLIEVDRTHTRLNRAQRDF
jgi:anti-sigma factor RsiW